MSRLHRLPPVPVAVLKKAAYAEPPGRVPRGYFDNLLTVTKTLLDRGLTLAAAADWLIERRSLPPNRRGNYLNTMKVRFTRLRYAAKPTAEFTWRQAMGGDGLHAVPPGRTKALCGSHASLWLDGTETNRRCRFCLHVINRGDS